MASVRILHGRRMNDSMLMDRWWFCELMYRSILCRTVHSIHFQPGIYGLSPIWQAQYPKFSDWLIEGAGREEWDCPWQSEQSSEQYSQTDGIYLMSRGSWYFWDHTVRVFGSECYIQGLLELTSQRACPMMLETVLWEIESDANSLWISHLCIRY